MTLAARASNRVSARLWRFGFRAFRFSRGVLRRCLFALCISLWRRAPGGSKTAKQNAAPRARRVR
eukprot:7951721-Lingulodinium_polyedra.AAC.1